MSPGRPAAPGACAVTHPPPPLVSRPPCRMPDQISVSEFIAETTEDYNSPTTSSFTTRLHNCRNTVTLLEEIMYKMKKTMHKFLISLGVIF
ncbi:arf-GAP with SH3 domain, ANK repeat and PH domain-containing protein 1-like isoform X2 [Callospermophilus lateralis]|uniref:arf-GAP with SH3 domain, ANK repeat and PH domain-containing protein 1-like isoform X2 n=2 Tax=Callospermophilus lateralis TaxID=76772 RepID=UPI00403893E0